MSINNISTIFPWKQFHEKAVKMIFTKNLSFFWTFNTSFRVSAILVFPRPIYRSLHFCSWIEAYWLKKKLRNIVLIIIVFLPVKVALRLPFRAGTSTASLLIGSSVDESYLNTIHIKSFEQFIDIFSFYSFVNLKSFKSCITSKTDDLYICHSYSCNVLYINVSLYKRHNSNGYPWYLEEKYRFRHFVH